MYDLLIEGGRLVLPEHGVMVADLAVSGASVAAIVAPGTSPSARERIDAAGKYVFPGVVDSHTHIGIGNGFDDFWTESASAALGGVTSYFAFLREPAPYEDVWRQAHEAAARLSLVDFGFHIVLLLEEHLDGIPSYVSELGITSFKLYMTYRGEDALMRTFALESVGFDGIDDGYIYEALKRLGREPRALAMVHCENADLIQRLRREAKESGAAGVDDWNASRPVVAELEAVRRAVTLGESVGARLHVLHVTTRDAIEELRATRGHFPGAHVEVCPPYLSTPPAELDRRWKFRPPIRGKNHVEGLWRGVFEGVVDSIGSDHVPRPLEAKSGDVWSPAAGAGGSQYILPFMLTEGFHRRGLPLERIAALVSQQPAQLYGVYPTKGTLLPGADADLVLVDLEEEFEVRADGYPSACDFSIYEGQLMRGRPLTTMVRGRTVVEDGEIVGGPGWGRYLPR